MAQIVISSDGSLENTTCTIDGKEVKNWQNMSMYCRQPMEDYPTYNGEEDEGCCDFSITTEEEDAKTGMMVRTTKSLCNDELVTLDQKEVADMIRKRKVRDIFLG